MLLLDGDLGGDGIDTNDKGFDLLSFSDNTVRPGGVGTHVVQLARLVGAAPIVAVDINPEVLERALDVGADHAFDSRDEQLGAKIAEVTGGRGLDVAFDAVGNLWISTDGNQLGSNDGLFRVPTNGPERGRVQQFLTVPFGAETCGPLVSPDQLSVFTAVQHPGETDDATFEKPTSTWPHTDAFPRPSVIVSYAK